MSWWHGLGPNKKPWPKRTLDVIITSLQYLPRTALGDSPRPVARPPAAHPRRANQPRACYSVAPAPRAPKKRRRAKKKSAPRKRRISPEPVRRGHPPPPRHRHPPLPPHPYPFIHVRSLAARVEHLHLYRKLTRWNAHARGLFEHHQIVVVARGLNRVRFKADLAFNTRVTVCECEMGHVCVCPFAPAW